MPRNIKTTADMPSTPPLDLGEASSGYSTPSVQSLPQPSAEMPYKHMLDMCAVDEKIEMHRALQQDLQDRIRRQRSMSSKEVEDVAAATRFRLHLDHDAFEDMIMPVSTKLGRKTERSFRLQKESNFEAKSGFAQARSSRSRARDVLPKLRTPTRPSALKFVPCDEHTPQVRSANLPLRSMFRGEPDLEAEEDHCQKRQFRWSIVTSRRSIQQTPIRDITPESARSFNFDFSPAQSMSTDGTRTTFSPPPPSRSSRSRDADQHVLVEDPLHQELERVSADDSAIDSDVCTAVQRHRGNDVDSLLDLYIGTEEDEQTHHDRYTTTSRQPRPHGPSRRKLSGLNMHPFQAF